MTVGSLGLSQPWKPPLNTQCGRKSPTFHKGTPSLHYISNPLHRKALCGNCRPLLELPQVLLNGQAQGACLGNLSLDLNLALQAGKKQWKALPTQSLSKKRCLFCMPSSTALAMPCLLTTVLLRTRNTLRGLEEMSSVCWTKETTHFSHF